MYEVDWDKVTQAHSAPEQPSGPRNSYIVRGRGMWGGCLDVQGKLSEYGLCRFVRWDPRPPDWTFLFDTHLSKMQIEAVLGLTKDRWQVEID